MKDLIESKRQDALVPRQGHELEPLPQQGGFFSFRYSSTELYSQDGNLHMKRRETRYQDGRLVSEECEGMLERQAYERMMLQAQGQFLSQLGSFMRMLNWWR